MNWLFMFFLCLIIVLVSVKSENMVNGVGWSYTIYYQNDNCTNPISACGKSTNTCTPNNSTSICVDKTIRSCVSTQTLPFYSNFAVLYSYSKDDANCDTPLSFEALINDQCVDGLKWSYPYILSYDFDNCTSFPNIKADYGNCNNYQKMMLGGAPPPPNSNVDSSREDDDGISDLTVSSVIVVLVIVLCGIAATLIYRYCFNGHIAFSTSAYYSSVQTTQGTADPVQNDGVVLELPTIDENHNDLSNTSTPLYPTYIENTTNDPPIVEGVAVVMTTNDV